MIKRFLIIFSFFFLFLMSPFLQGEMSRLNRDRGISTSVIFAQTATSSATPSATTTTAKPSWWQQFLNWITGLFVNTDYTINVRDPNAINSDMTDYGNKNDSNYKDKHSFAGSRLTDSTSQECLKGNVIKQATLGTDNNYPNSGLSQICSNSSSQCVIQPNDVSDPNLTKCHQVTVKDLAHYFVQIQKQFYCATDSNNLVDTEQNIIDQINKDYTANILDNELDCYQKIYDDFYLTPKDSSDTKEENTTKIMQTPISADNQNSSNDSNQIKDQIDQNFSPDGTSAGLGGLRPDDWSK